MKISRSAYEWREVGVGVLQCNGFEALTGFMLHRPRRGSPVTPLGIDTAIGSLVVVSALFIAAGLPTAQVWWRLAVATVALAGFAAAVPHPAAVAIVTVVVLMLHNGFLLDRAGRLAWHGTLDLEVGLILVLAATVGLLLGRAFGRGGVRT